MVKGNIETITENVSNQWSLRIQANAITISQLSRKDLL